jgi:hypothetical protein
MVLLGADHLAAVAHRPGEPVGGVAEPGPELHDPPAPDGPDLELEEPPHGPADDGEPFGFGPGLHLGQDGVVVLDLVEPLDVLLDLLVDVVHTPPSVRRPAARSGYRCDMGPQRHDRQPP